MLGDGEYKYVDVDKGLVDFLALHAFRSWFTPEKKRKKAKANKKEGNIEKVGGRGGGDSLIIWFCMFQARGFHPNVVTATAFLFPHKLSLPNSHWFLEAIRTVVIFLRHQCCFEVSP